jgi:hypothetical protein
VQIPQATPASRETTRGGEAAARRTLRQGPRRLVDAKTDVVVRLLDLARKQRANTPTANQPVVERRAEPVRVVSTMTGAGYWWRGWCEAPSCARLALPTGADPAVEAPSAAENSPSRTCVHISRVRIVQSAPHESGCTPLPAVGETHHVSASTPALRGWQQPGFKIRATGVAIDRQRLLVHTVGAEPAWWALPGGGPNFQ